MTKNTRTIVLLVVLVIVIGLGIFAYQWNKMPATGVQPVASSTLPVSTGAQSTNTTSGSTGTHPVTTTPPGKILYPTLTKIAPSSGSTGTFVTLYGSGFNATSQILIGSGAIAHPTVNSTGTTLSFTMPSSVGAYCKAGQACPMFELLLQPGTYQLSVENGDGSKSGTFPFVLTASAQ